MESFTTHTGEVVTGTRLTVALDKVVTDWENLAKRIRIEDKYASHVTDAQKEQYMAKMIESSHEIRAGKDLSLTILQRLNTVLTGVCVPLIS